MPVSIQNNNLPESQNSAQHKQEFIDELSDEIDAFIPGKPVDSADYDAIDENYGNNGNEKFMETRELSQLYRVTTKQGDGGCSVVYDAWRIEDGAHVALKVLALSPMLAPEAAERARKLFFDEARILTSFVDEHIVKCLNYGVFNGAPCVVLEFISGKQLDEYIRDYGTLPYEYAIGIIRQVLLALEEAHNKGIIHRDVKPANILIIRETEPPVVKLIDFGIATISERTEGSLNRTPNGIIRGTPSYMAPELFSGDKTASVESDLYAIGLILLECLTGSVAYAAPSLMQVAYQQVNEDLSIPTFIPECLAHIIKKCCEKDSAKRYHAARDLIIDLDNALPMALAQKDKCEQNYLKSIETAAPKIKQKQSNNLTAIIAIIACLIAVGAAVIVVLNMPKDPPIQNEQAPAQAAPVPTPSETAAPVQAPAPSEPAPPPSEPAPTPDPAPVEPAQAEAPEQPMQEPAPAQPAPIEPPAQAAVQPDPDPPVAAAEPQKQAAQKPAAKKTKPTPKTKPSEQPPKPSKSGKKAESTYLPTSMF